MALVRFAGQLRKLVNGNVELNFTASNISECIKNLDAQFPGIKENLCDKDLKKAFLKAYSGDPISAFGGIVGFNRRVTERVAKEILKIRIENMKLCIFVRINLPSLRNFCLCLSEQNSKNPFLITFFAGFNNRPQ